MIDYSAWTRKKISITSLRLDERNPRLPEDLNISRTPTQPQIINYFIEFEKVFELAKRIVTMGYLLNEEPIVTKEDGKYVVLEGNRRVAACKIIVNPDLIKSKAKRNNLYALISERGFRMNKLDCRVSEVREDADVLIFNRHNDGSPVEKWDKTKQDRFVYSKYSSGESIKELTEKFGITKGELKASFTRHFMYKELLDLDLPNNIRKDLEDETKFSMTNVERFYSSKMGRDFLGIEISASGNIDHKLPIQEYKKRLSKIAEDVVTGKLTSRTYGDEAGQKKYINDLHRNKSFDFDTIPDSKYKSEYNKVEIEIDNEVEDIVTKPKRTISTDSKNSIMSTDINFKIGVTRIDKIFIELKRIDLNKFPNATAVLFRSYLDMIIYQFLLTNGHLNELKISQQKELEIENTKKLSKVMRALETTESILTQESELQIKKAVITKLKVNPDYVPTLKQMLTLIVQSEHILVDSKLKQALKQYVNGSTSFLDHTDFNLLVHNEYHFKNGAEIKAAWEHLQPLLIFVNSKIKNNVKPQVL